MAAATSAILGSPFAAREFSISHKLGQSIDLCGDLGFGDATDERDQPLIERHALAILIGYASRAIKPHAGQVFIAFLAGQPSRQVVRAFDRFRRIRPHGQLCVQQFFVTFFNRLRCRVLQRLS